MIVPCIQSARRFSRAINMSDRHIQQMQLLTSRLSILGMNPLPPIRGPRPTSFSHLLSPLIAAVSTFSLSAFLHSYSLVFSIWFLSHPFLSFASFSSLLHPLAWPLSQQLYQHHHPSGKKCNGGKKSINKAITLPVLSPSAEVTPAVRWGDGVRWSWRHISIRVGVRVTYEFGVEAAVSQGYYCGHDPSPAVLLSVQPNVMRWSRHRLSVRRTADRLPLCVP